MFKIKKLKNVFMAKDGAICLIILIAAAFPVGSMGGVKVDCAYTSIYLFFKGLIGSNLDFNLIFCMMYSGAFIILGCLHCPYGFRNCDEHPKLVGSIFLFVSCVFSYLVIIISAYTNFNFYRLTSNTLPLVIVIMIVDAVSIMAEYFIFRKEPKIEDNGQITECNSEDKTEEKESASKAKGKRIARYYNSLISKIALNIALIVCCLYFYPSNLNRMFYFSGINYGNVINYRLGESYIGANGVDDEYINNFIVNFQEGSRHIFNYSSANYHYWQNRIEEKQDEMRQLMPDSSSENALKKYAEQIAKLKAEIEVIKENLETLKYENIKVTTVSGSETHTEYWGLTNTRYYAEIIEILYDTQYNGGSSSVIKWNNRENKRLFCGQSIELTQTEFKAGTDFSSVKIGATINYFDGSMKKSYITVSNYQELNNASSGKRTLKWSDNWGDYEYEIIII